MNAQEKLSWLLSIEKDLNILAVKAFERLSEQEFTATDQKFINENSEGFLFSLSTIRRALQGKDWSEIGKWEETYADQRYWELVYPTFLEVVLEATHTPGNEAA